MRFFFICLVLVGIGCTQPKPQSTTQKVVNTAIADSLIQSIDLLMPQSNDSLNVSNLVQLMESLAEIPFEQRQVTLKSIKQETKSLLNQPWPERLDINPIRSRYVVFITDAHIAADKRLGQNAAVEQAKNIIKMKNSWNIFVSQMSTSESSAVLETTLR